MHHLAPIEHAEKRQKGLLPENLSAPFPSAVFPFFWQKVRSRKLNSKLMRATEKQSSRESRSWSPFVHTRPFYARLECNVWRLYLFFLANNNLASMCQSDICQVLIDWQMRNTSNVKTSRMYGRQYTTHCSRCWQEVVNTDQQNKLITYFHNHCSLLLDQTNL